MGKSIVRMDKNRVRKLPTGKVERNGLNKWKNVAMCHPKQQAMEEFFQAKKADSLNKSTGYVSQFALTWRSRFKSRQESLPLERYKFVDRN